MATDINDLTAILTANDDDVLVLFDRSNSATRRISVGAFKRSLPLPDSLSFDNTSRTLTMNLTNGETLTVNIPA